MLTPADADAWLGSVSWRIWSWPTGGSGWPGCICPTSTWPASVPARDDLFATHPQSPIPPAERAGFSGVRYFPPNPEAVVEASLRPASGDLRVDTGGPDGVVAYRRVAVAETPWGPLTLWWIEAYGGGLFVPLRDGTCGRETYGGGRYLTDTVKGTFGRGVERCCPATGSGWTPTTSTTRPVPTTTAGPAPRAAGEPGGRRDPRRGAGVPLTPPRATGKAAAARTHGGGLGANAEPAGGGCCGQRCRVRRPGR